MNWGKIAWGHFSTVFQTSYFMCFKLHHVDTAFLFVQFHIQKVKSKYKKTMVAPRRLLHPLERMSEVHIQKWMQTNNAVAKFFHVVVCLNGLQSMWELYSYISSWFYGSFKWIFIFLPWSEVKLSFVFFTAFLRSWTSMVLGSGLLPMVTSCKNISQNALYFQSWGLTKL